MCWKTFLQHTKILPPSKSLRRISINSDTRVRAGEWPALNRKPEHPSKQHWETYVFDSVKKFRSTTQSSPDGLFDFVMGSIFPTVCITSVDGWFLNCAVSMIFYSRKCRLIWGLLLRCNVVLYTPRLNNLAGIYKIIGGSNPFHNIISDNLIFMIYLRIDRVEFRQNIEKFMRI